jgi:V8-like Glu-specific endopeptidase
MAKRKRPPSKPRKAIPPQTGKPPQAIHHRDHESVSSPPQAERPAPPNREYLGPDAAPPKALRGDGEPLLVARRPGPDRLQGAWRTSPAHVRVLHIPGPAVHRSSGELPSTLTRIDKTVAIPWRYICQLEIFDAVGRRHGGTGFLVGRRTILTAGHNVYQFDIRQWAHQINVAIARNGGGIPYPVQPVGDGFQSVAGWINGNQPECDYGAILLPASVDAGSFGVDVYDDNDLSNLWITTAGYPVAPLVGAYGTMWGDSGIISTVVEQQIAFTPAIPEGISGGPAFVTLGEDRIVVGIMNYASDNGFAVATRINSPVLQNILKWRSLAGE